MGTRGFLGLATVLMALPAAQATSISWGSPTNIASSTDVMTSGTLSYAYDFTGGTVVVNGVSFSNFPTTGTTTSVTNGNLTVATVGNNDVMNFTGFLAGAMTGTYGTLVGSADYASASGSSSPITAQPLDVTLGGLTIGDSYSVEIWVNDSRTITSGFFNPTTRTETVDGGPTLSFQTGTGNGQFLVGTFVATGATQGFVVQGFDTNAAHGNAASELTALELSDTTGTPEPSSMLLVGLGSAGLFYFARRRSARQ